MLPSLRINPSGVAKFRGEARSCRQLAMRLGVDPGTAHRVLHGQQAPGHKFIAGFIKAFGAHRLPEIFDIVDS